MTGGSRLSSFSGSPIARDQYQRRRARDQYQHRRRTKPFQETVVLAVSLGAYQTTRRPAPSSRPWSRSAPHPLPRSRDPARNGSCNVLHILSPPPSLAGALSFLPLARAPSLC
eukprot:388378-Rhodomonas_salina.1